MAQNIFRLVLTDEAQDFIESLPEAVSYKIYYNIKRVAGGERNKELFKKLENSEIWEFRLLKQPIMKKIISVFFALCICLSVSAQEHMKFMGIPLDGTIDNFALKLKAKGITYDAAKSRAMGLGGKFYNGTFMGEKATFMVFFNAKSRIVFGVSVELSYSSVNLAHVPFVNIAEQLLKKYPKAVYEANKDSKGDTNGVTFSIPNKAETERMGVIIQTLNKSQSYLKDDCTISLMYTDVENFKKSETINNEDL